MNEMYKDPELRSFGQWMAILIEHREGRISDGELLSKIIEIQDAYKDLHYSLHAAVGQFNKPYKK